MAGIDLKVRGADKLKRVAASLEKHAEGKTLRRELLLNISRAVRPIAKAQRANLKSRLPKRGGLAAAASCTRQGRW